MVVPTTGQTVAMMILFAKYVGCRLLLLVLELSEVRNSKDKQTACCLRPPLRPRLPCTPRSLITSMLIGRPCDASWVELHARTGLRNY